MRKSCFHQTTKVGGDCQATLQHHTPLADVFCLGESNPPASDQRLVCSFGCWFGGLFVRRWFVVSPQPRLFGLCWAERETLSLFSCFTNRERIEEKRGNKQASVRFSHALSQSLPKECSATAAVCVWRGSRCSDNRETPVLSRLVLVVVVVLYLHTHLGGRFEVAARERVQSQWSSPFRVKLTS